MWIEKAIPTVLCKCWTVEAREGAVKNEQEKKLQESSELETTIRVCGTDIDRKTAELKSEEVVFGVFEIKAYPVVQKAVEIYEKYLENGKNGPGGLLATETRRRLQRSIEQHKKALFGRQAAYNAKHADLGLPTARRAGKSSRPEKTASGWIICRRCERNLRSRQDGMRIFSKMNLY